MNLRLRYDAVVASTRDEPVPEKRVVAYEATGARTSMRGPWRVRFDPRRKQKRYRNERDNNCVLNWCLSNAGASTCTLVEKQSSFPPLWCVRVGPSHPTFAAVTDTWCCWQCPPAHSAGSFDFTKVLSA